MVVGQFFYLYDKGLSKYCLGRATKKLGMYNEKVLTFTYIILREMCPYSELFWSVFPRIPTEYGEILLISPYSMRMRRNTDQNNSEHGHFLRSVVHSCLRYSDINV